MANPSLVGQVVGDVDSTAQASRGKKAPNKTVGRGGTPAQKQTETDSISCLRQKFRSEGLSLRATELAEKAWRPTTQGQYRTYIKKWCEFCSTRKIDAHSAPLSEVAEFLTDLYHAGFTYSAINTARSALSNILPDYQGKPVGQNFVICKILKGIYQSRPSFPRYSEIWDVDIVLKYLQKQSPCNNLDLKSLSQKIVTLLAVLTGHRCQTLRSIKCKNITFNHGKMSIKIDELQKTSRPGHHIGNIVLQNFAPDRRLCVVTYMREYLKRTKVLRNSEYLFINTQNPHGQISKDALSKWIRNTLKSAGIDTKIFKSHSTRTAAASKMSDISIPIHEIMGNIGWTKASTFQTYYKKPIKRKTDVGQAILKLATR